jgi:hypothetical protein
MERKMANEEAQDLGITPDSTTAFGKRAETFDALVRDYEGISGAIRSLEEEKKALQDKLKLYFTDSGIKTVVVANLQSKVTLVVNQGRSTIDKIKLLEHGVAAQTIVECTVQGDPYSFVKVTSR